MMQATFRPAKDFFFDRQRVIDSLDKAKRSRLARQGAIVRTFAKRSIRPARRRSLGSMTEDEQTAYKIRSRIAAAEGQPKPKLPFASSEPGKPPRNRTGLLRDKILFAYDPNSESVVVGPALLNGGNGAPETLEFGGRNDRGVFVEPRPFMQPALASAVGKYPSVFEDSMQ
jgi:hypothetical protein